MKNKIKLFICLTLIITIFMGCTRSKSGNYENSDKIVYNPSEVIEIIKNNNKLPEEYAELGAAYLINNKKTTVYEDGSSEIHYFYITQIINYEGKKKLSDIVIDYDSDNESLILGDMYTVTKDYKKV